MFKLFTPLIELLCRSIRIEIRNEKVITELSYKRQPFVVVFWHGTMFLAWWWMRRNNPAALVSQSKDGEILSNILQRWDYHLIRGSSSRGSKEAMDSMVQVVKDGYNLCVTPDGPHGPKHVMKMGAIRVAQKTGSPIILLGIGIRRKKILKSWDNFWVPLPFTKCLIECSDPIYIDGDETIDLEPARNKIEETFHELSQRCEAGLITK